MGKQALQKHGISYNSNGRPAGKKGGAPGRGRSLSHKSKLSVESGGSISEEIVNTDQ